MKDIDIIKSYDERFKITKDYKIHNLDYLKKLHDIEITKIRGYKNLSEPIQNIFKKAIVNFFNAQGIQSRASLEIISVKLCSNYIRLDYIQHGRREWIHILNELEWY